MRDNIKIHISQSLMERTATILEGVAAQRRELIGKSSETIEDAATSHWDDNSALDAARQLERDAHEIRLCLQYLPEKATEQDQLAVIEALRDELEKEGLPRGYSYSSPAQDIRGMFRHAMDQRKQAFDAWAALVDNQRVNLRAIKLMTERALQCDTHRRKDSTLYVLLDIMQNMLVDLLEIDTDEPDDYGRWSHRQSTSWEVRKVLSKNRQLEARIKAMESAGKDEAKSTVIDGDDLNDSF